MFDQLHAFKKAGNCSEKIPDRRLIRYLIHQTKENLSQISIVNTFARDGLTFLPYR
jgi:hypothetical protein